MRLRDNWKEKGLFGKVGRELNIIAKWLNGMTGYGGVQVRHTTTGIKLDGAAGGIDLSLFNFGINSFFVAPTRIKLNSGLVQIGTVRVAVNATEIKISGTPAYVIMRIDKASRTASWLTSTASAIPADTPQYSYVPFYEFVLLENSDEHELFRIHHTGNVP